MHREDISEILRKAKNLKIEIGGDGLRFFEMTRNKIGSNYSNLVSSLN